jgi:hypothetical protein
MNSSDIQCVIENETLKTQNLKFVYETLDSLLCQFPDGQVYDSIKTARDNVGDAIAEVQAKTRALEIQLSNRSIQDEYATPQQRRDFWNPLG